MPGGKPATTTTNGTTNTNQTTNSDFSNWLNGSQTGNTNATGTVNSGGWAPAQGNLQDILTRAGTLSQGSSFTPTQSAQTGAAIQGMTNYAQGPTATGTNGASIGNTATGAYGTGIGGLTTTAQGGMLNGNPYLDSALSTSLDNTANRVNQQFSGAGRYGSAAHTGALTRELGAIEANARLGNYNTERGYQNAAQGALAGQGGMGLGAAGAVDQGVLSQLGVLQSAGAGQDAWDAANRQAPLNAVEWLRNQTVPIAATGQSGTTTNQGSTSQATNNTSGGTQNGTQVGTGTTNQTQQVQQPSNPWGMLGGGLMAGLGMLSGNPMALSNIGSNLSSLWGALR